LSAGRERRSFGDRQFGSGLQRAGREDQIHLVEREELLELASDRVLGLGQDTDQVVGGERGQRDYNR